MKRWSVLLPVLALLVMTFGTSGRAQEKTEKQPGVFSHLHFRDLGPAVAGGRVTTVVGIPGNPNIYYVGAAGGGVWKTTDGGEKWKPIFQHEDTSSIGAIALAPSNPNLVWVGTGEANIRNDTIDGGGLYFSPDGGHTWSLMGFRNAGQISSVLVDPHDSDTVFVGVLGHAWGPNDQRGLFKTTDGGKTWKKVLYVNDTTGVIDLVMAPGNPKVLLAAMWQMQRRPWTLDDGGPGSGIYRSVDGGKTWKKLTHGLPKGPLGRIALAFAPSNPDRIYALVEAKHGLLWKSNDMGDSWTPVSDDYALDVRPFYFSHLAVAPNDENKIYSCSLQLMESDNGGRTVHVADRGVHSDHHSLWIDPRDPSRIIEGTDGGVYLSLDGAKHWRFLDGLPIEEDYMVGVSRQVPYTLCAGLQDNNSWCGNQQKGWYTVTGGDGEYAIPAPSNPKVVYTDSQNGSLSRLDLSNNAHWSIRPYIPGVEQEPPADLKYRFNWTSPIAVSPTDANEVYLGANVLFRTTNGGKTWTAISPDLTRNDKSKQIVPGGPVEYDISGAETYDTIMSITIAPSNPKVIWVGSDDGMVHVTRDGGKTWTDVTANISGAPKWARIYQIGVSPFNPGTAYVSFDAHMLDNTHAYVYRTRDFGHTWQEITDGLPNEPVHVVREDPNRRGLLVLGNNIGLYYSTNDGDHWQKFPVEFPTVPVWDLQFVKKEHDLAVATHGRGLLVLNDIRPIEEMTPQIASADFHLFTINNAYLLDRSFFGMRGRHSSMYSPRPAPEGAAIDYYLKTAIESPEETGSGTQSGSAKKKGPVTITVTDAAGHPVATDSGPGKAGVNRFVWDLRYDPATPIKGASQPRRSSFFRNRTSPQVAPGTYKVTVAANGRTETQTVTVLAQPGISIVPGAFQQEVAFALQARDMLSAVDEMVNRIGDIKSQVAMFSGAGGPGSEEAGEPQSKQLLAKGTSLTQQLGKVEQPVYNTKVQRGVGEDDIHFLTDLHGQIQNLMRRGWIGYGQPPTAQAREEMAVLRKELDQRLAAFNHLLQTQVAEYNRLAQAAKVPKLLGGAPIAVKATAAPTTR